jgi:Flp pilus assembly protein TadG
MRHRTTRHTPRDRGAAVVEFALVLPLLLLLVFGIIDFGRALNAQITLTQAAREGARLDAIGSTAVTSGTTGAATGLSGVTVAIGYTCQLNDEGKAKDAKVTANYTFTFLTPVSAIAGLFGSTWGSTIPLSATGVMPCET